MSAGPDRSASEARQRRRIGDWERVSFGTHCVNCFPGNCPLYVFTRGETVVREEAAGVLEPVEPGVPDMNPLVCQKGLAWSLELAGPERITHPLRRAGERGEGRWQRISWEEALAEVADAILDAIEELGPEAVVMEMSPEIAAVVPSSRFMSLLGGTLLDVNATINDFWTGYQQTFGKFSFAPSADDLFHADCLLLWHANPAYTYIPTYHYLTEARYRGAESVLISTDLNPSHGHADYCLPVRHGTDAALALALCQVVVAEGLLDREFVVSQTDLSLLVHRDTGRFLREADLRDGGRDDRFFHAHPERGVVPADPASLRLAFEPQLEGELRVRTRDGHTRAVEPLFTRLRRQLDAAYTPERAAAICEVHPETIRTLARKVAGRRTRVVLGAGIAKYYHGDLMTRAILLLLALTGNWGRKGTGLSGWCSSLFDGMSTGMAKTEPGPEAARALVDGFRGLREQLRAQDPTLTGELVDRALWKLIAAGQNMVPPVFYWYWHAGYRERWNRREWNDPAMPRDFDAYFEQALASTGWSRSARPGPQTPPRVLLEIGGNTLRRTRGGQRTILEHVWPKLRKVVCMDYRMSQTALWADLVLPAAQHYEKTTFGMPTPWTMFLSVSDAAVPPAGEARAEWTALAELLRVLAERARARGLESYIHRDGQPRRFADLPATFTLRGTVLDDESAAAEMIRDAVATGNLPDGTTLESFRERGYCRYADWSFMALAQAQASPFPRGETHAPLRNHVERGDPYPTLTHRAQFLIDHPWYLEAGEELPVHKEPPAMGGEHPFRLSGGHSRWSVHAMNMTNPLILETHRGKPFVLVNDADARAKGIADDGLVRIWNDVGEFVVPARTSPTQRPGALTVYNGFEGFMFPGGRGSNEVEPGMVKWLHLVPDYGHLAYAPTEWQPVPFDRCIRVDCEPWRGDRTPLPRTEDES